MYWFARLLVLTDPASPRGAIEVKTDTLAQSLAILELTGEVIGGRSTRRCRDAARLPGGSVSRRRPRVRGTGLRVAWSAGGRGVARAIRHITGVRGRPCRR